MIFQEVGPNENLDVRRFSSASFGLWEAGVLKMGWGDRQAARSTGPLEAFPWDVQQINLMFRNSVLELATAWIL